MDELQFHMDELADSPELLTLHPEDEMTDEDMPTHIENTSNTQGTTPSDSMTWQNHPPGQEFLTNLFNPDVPAEMAVNQDTSSSRISTGFEYGLAAGMGGESADDMILRLSNEFAPIVEDDWDTVIWIGAPPQEHGMPDNEYAYIQQHFAKPYLMKSTTLKELGSAQFAKFLGPMSARTERRLKKLGVHQLIDHPEQAKYYIDLRPMRDDDEALLMISELSCTHGILSWHLSAAASGLPKTLVCGRDDLNVANSFNRPHSKSGDKAKELFRDQNKDDQPLAQEDLEPEYSALRHHVAIERLLHAIAGRDPKLNSAAKCWTYFAIAKYFDCAPAACVSGWIYTWLFSNSNAHFIQANPETAYRMGLGMQSSDLARVTFAILVGEKALTVAYDQFWHPAGTRSKTVHDRVLNHLDDDEINRIDHAAHSLQRRILAMFDKIANDPMSWMQCSAEVRKLSNVTPTGEEQQQALYDTWQALRDYARGEIYQALSQVLDETSVTIPASRQRVAGERGQRELWKMLETYQSLALPQRLLTQSFWGYLQGYGFFQDAAASKAWSEGHNLRGLGLLAPDFAGHTGQEDAITCVAKSTLIEVVRDLNFMMMKRPWKSPFAATDTNAVVRQMATQYEVSAEGHVVKREPGPPTTTPMPALGPGRGTFQGLDVTYAGASAGGSSSGAAPAASGTRTTVPRELLPQPRELVKVAEVSPRNTYATTAKADVSGHDTMSSVQDQGAKTPSVETLREFSALTLVHRPKRRIEELPETMLMLRDAPPQWQRLASGPNSGEVISVSKLLAELTAELRRVIDREILVPSYLKGGESIASDIPTGNLDILLCLTDEEWKYLPLWAGGNDDGSGGVFVELDVPDIPDVEGINLRFKGGKQVMTDDSEYGEDGHSVANGSDFEDITTDEGVSTVGKASRIATNGTRSSAADTVMSMDE